MDIAYSKSLARRTVEEDYKFLEWAQKIRKEVPPLHFKEKWNVMIVPPFGNAMARFCIGYNEKFISVYLDCYEELGLHGGQPYWEIWGEFMGEVERFDLNDTEKMMERINYYLGE